MSIYSNVTKQFLNNLRKFAEQQKDQFALKIENRIFKQSLDIKLAEILSPITKKLDEVKETTRKIGDVIEESQPETSQLATENSEPQLQIENNQDDTPPGELYYVPLENTLTNKKKEQKGFFQIKEDQKGQRVRNKIPVAESGDSRVEIKGKNFKLTPNLQNVFTDTTGKSLKNLIE